MFAILGVIQISALVLSFASPAFAQPTKTQQISELSPATLGACSQQEIKIKRTSVKRLASLIDQTAQTLGVQGQLLSPLEWRKETSSFGLPRLDLPQSFGGQNMKASQIIHIFEHAGRIALDLRDVVGGAHVRPLLQSQESEVLNIVRQVANGKGYMAIAITEPDVGSNMRAMSSRSEKVEGGYKITGEKLYNARFSTASHVIS